MCWLEVLAAAVLFLFNKSCSGFSPSNPRPLKRVAALENRPLLTLVNTVDGKLHAVDASMNVLWDLDTGGSLSGSHHGSVDRNYSIIPTIDGTIVTHSRDGVRKTSVSARMLAERTTYMSAKDRLIFTGHTKSRVFAVNPLTGEVLVDTNNIVRSRTLHHQNSTVDSPVTPLWLSRVDYSVSAVEMDTGQEAFNISFSEVEPMSGENLENAGESEHGLASPLEEGSVELQRVMLASPEGAIRFQQDGFDAERLDEEISGEDGFGGVGLEDDDPRLEEASISLGSTPVAAYSVSFDFPENPSQGRKGFTKLEKIRINYKTNLAVLDSPAEDASGSDTETVLVQYSESSGLYAIVIPAEQVNQEISSITATGHHHKVQLGNWIKNGGRKKTSREQYRKRSAGFGLWSSRFEEDDATQQEKALAAVSSTKRGQSRPVLLMLEPPPTLRSEADTLTCLESDAQECVSLSEYVMHQGEDKTGVESRPKQNQKLRRRHERSNPRNVRYKREPNRSKVKSDEESENAECFSESYDKEYFFDFWDYYQSGLSDPSAASASIDQAMLSDELRGTSSVDDNTLRRVLGTRRGKQFGRAGLGVNVNPPMDIESLWSNDAVFDTQALDEMICDWIDSDSSEGKPVIVSSDEVAKSDLKTSLSSRVQRTPADQMALTVNPGLGVGGYRNLVSNAMRKTGAALPRRIVSLPQGEQEQRKSVFSPADSDTTAVQLTSTETRMTKEQITLQKELMETRRALERAICSSGRMLLNQQEYEEYLASDEGTQSFPSAVLNLNSPEASSLLRFPMCVSGHYRLKKDDPPYEKPQIRNGRLVPASQFPVEFLDRSHFSRRVPDVAARDSVPHVDIVPGNTPYYYYVFAAVALIALGAIFAFFRLFVQSTPPQTASTNKAANLGSVEDLVALSLPRDSTTTPVVDVLLSTDASSSPAAVGSAREGIIPGTTRVGSLSVSSEVLGRGSHGTIIFRGYLNDGRPVAVKRMLAEFNTTADREISTLIRSDGNTNVVRYHLREKTGEFVYLALQLCDMSLRDFVAKISKKLVSQQQLSRQDVPQAARDALLQIANGLEHLHKNRIVHRDMKPHNILILRREATPESAVAEAQEQIPIQQLSDIQHFVLKIGDMGFSKQLNLERDSVSFSMSASLAIDRKGGSSEDNGLMGTIGWQAPEILLLRDRCETEESDIVSPTVDDVEQCTPSHESNDSDLEDEEREADGGDGGLETILEAETHQTTASAVRRRIRRKLQRQRTQKADVFSLGCIFHYTLVPGQHPFGAWHERESNIRAIAVSRDQQAAIPNLDHLAEIPDAMHLLRLMLHRDPLCRPAADQVSRHPFFWTPDERCQFLLQISDKLDNETSAEILLRVESVSSTLDLLRLTSPELYNRLKYQSRPWTRFFPATLVEEVSSRRKYDGSSVKDLLRLLRNLAHHIGEFSSDVRSEIGEPVDLFLEYFEKRFPWLLLHCVALASAFYSRETQFMGHLSKIAVYFPVAAAEPQDCSAADNNALSPPAVSSNCSGISPVLQKEIFEDENICCDNCEPPENDTIVERRGWYEQDWATATRLLPAKRYPPTDSGSNLLNRLSQDLRYRSRLCNHWDGSNGTNCPMKKKGKCDFAHGPMELRAKFDRLDRWGRPGGGGGGNVSSNSKKFLVCSGGEDVVGAARSIEKARAVGGTNASNASTLPKKT